MEEEKGKGEGEGRKRALPFPSPIRTSPSGRGAATLEAFLSFPVWPIKAQYEFRNSPVLRKIPESLGTFPMSEYSLPIYRSLPLDHFETPRHVRDLIRDSELSSVIKSHNS